MDRNQLIGKDNRLPWHLSADLKRFKRITMGKPIIMGRKTHESIGKPLPGRTNIVVSTNPNYKVEDCTVVGSLPAALDAAYGADEIMIIGGAALFEQALLLADRIYLTRVECEFEGDVWFPQIDWKNWEEKDRQKGTVDQNNPYPYSFVLFERRKYSG